VIDVKPNNTLVIEARKTIQTNDEIKVLVLSGVCRRDDVTNANTVLSSQLADLTIIQTTEGELRDGSKKGWITGLFEAIFNF
jgi:flagellar L-ring protein precursor FlgH